MHAQDGADYAEGDAEIDPDDEWEDVKWGWEKLLRQEPHLKGKPLYILQQCAVVIRLSACFVHQSSCCLQFKWDLISTPSAYHYCSMICLIMQEIGVAWFNRQVLAACSHLHCAVCCSPALC